MKIQQIKQLAELIDEGKISRSAILGDGPIDDNVEQLYQLLLTNSADEALRILFPPGKYAKGAVDKIRFLLSEKLINTLFLLNLDQPGYTDQKRAYFKCQKDVAAIHLLLQNDVHTSAVDICKRVLKHALEYEFTEIVVTVSRLLSMHYIVRDYDPKKYQQYQRLYEVQRARREAEMMAEDMHLQILFLYKDPKNRFNEIAVKAKLFYQHLEQQYPAAPTFLYAYCYHYLKMTALMCNFKYVEAIDVCSGAVEALQKYRGNRLASSQVFLLNQMVCAIQLKDSVQGDQIYHSLMQTYPQQGTSMWFTCLEYGIKLMLHTKRYEQGFVLFKEGKLHKMLAKMPLEVRERWQLLHLYFYVLAITHQLGLAAKESLVQDFSFGKALNQIQKIEKQKIKHNVSILIIQFVVYLVKKQHDWYIDQLEALTQYGYRYFRNGLSKRTLIFIRILKALPVAGFALPRVEPRVRKLLAQLRATAKELQPHEIEVMPYEDIWGLVAAILSRRER